MKLRNELDRGLYVRFYKKTTFSDGKYINEPHDYIEIRVLAANKQLYNNIASEEHKKRFSEEYERFQNDEDQVGLGTPLTSLPSITFDQLSICKHLRLHTIEQVAHIDDDNIKNLGVNGRALVRECQKYVNSSSGLEEKLQSQSAEIAELKEQLAQVLASKPKRRTRKKVVEDESTNDSTESDKTI